MTKMKCERPLYAPETALCYKDLKGKRQVPEGGVFRDDVSAMKFEPVVKVVSGNLTK
jgi:hypothetical protein